MADIREVPLDNSESPVDIEEIQAEITQPVVDIEKTPKKAKAKGRPAGAKNKGPSKPRAKRVVFQEPVASEADDVAAYQGYEPSSPRRNLPIPAYGVNDVAVEMLRLLSDQQQAKAERKRRLYQSWFN